MANTRISALTASTTPLAGTEVLPIVQSSTTKQVSVANLTAGRAVSASSLTATGTVSAAIVTSSGIVASTGANLGHAASRVIMSYEGGSNSYIQPYSTSSGTQGNLYIRCMSSDGSLSTTAAVFEASNVTVSTGNLVIGTAAKGINFTANTPAAGMTSQLLNWYEEGTFTPVLKFSGTTTGITYSTQTGKYTRVGRLVTAYLKIALSSKGSASGSGEIYGLPFTVPTSGLNIPVSVYISTITFTGALNFQAEGTTDRIALQQVSVLGAVSYLTDANFANNSVVQISISYMV